MSLLDNLLDTTSYQSLFYFLIPFLLIIILVQLRYKIEKKENFEASRNNSLSSDFSKTLKFDKAQEKQLEKRIKKLDEDRAKQFLVDYDSAGKINLQLEELHNEITLLKSKLKSCTDKKRVKPPKEKIISLCANPKNETRSTMVDSSSETSNNSNESVESFVPSVSLPSTKSQSKEKQQAVPCKPNFLESNKNNSFANNPNRREQKKEIPIPKPKKDLLAESPNDKKKEESKKKEKKKEVPKKKERKEVPKKKENKEKSKKKEKKKEESKKKERKEFPKKKEKKIEAPKKKKDIDSTSSTSMSTDSDISVVVPDVEVNIKPIQTTYVVGCESDKDCNLFYGDGKNTCKSNHQCRCEVGAGKLCQLGPTNYKDPKDMTEKEKTIFKNLSNYDNFTIQDYKNWLGLYKRDYYLLSDEHLINLRKALRGEPIALRDIPTGGLRPPLTSQKYFAEMYDKLGDLEQIVSPINSSTTGAQVGYNYNEYSDFAPPNAIPQLRVVNGEIERKYRRPSAKNKIFPVPLEDSIGPFQSNPAM
jgi:hypothetical protein